MRVLGIDPGLTRCGVGVVEGKPGRPGKLIAYYVVYSSAFNNPPTTCTSSPFPSCI